MKYLLFPILIIYSFSVHGQTIDDALRYSFLDYGGSARTIGIGGAIGALGSDFSSLSINPGGLGNYRKSEFVISPFLNFNRAKSVVALGNEVSDSRTKFGFQNLGFIFHRKPQNAKWTSFNVGIGFNQRVNFNQKFAFEGKTIGSIADRWLALAFDGVNPIQPDNLDNFEAGLAFETGAIYDPNSADGILEYTNDFFDSPDVLKSQTIENKGSLNELLLALGWNYDNRISFGITAGLPILNFTQQKIYEEVDDGEGRDGNIPGFNSLRFVENLTTSGVGFNVKAGVTIRVSQSLRVGLAAHSPMNIRPNDNFNNLLTFSFNDNNGIPVNPDVPTGSGNGVFEYRLKTPLRVLGSVAYIIKRKGFISGELEFLDYSKNAFDLTLNDNSQSTTLINETLNNQINNDLGVALNLRVGGEYVLGKAQIRGGLGVLGSPYQADSNVNINYSLGFGYRSEGYYLDLAYRLFSYTQDYSPYNLIDDNLETQVEVNGNSHQIVTTIGFRF